MRHLYTLLLYLLIPAVLLRLAWRGWQSPAYWRRWPERFGFVPERANTQTSGHDVLWLHAVSVGEVQAAVPIISALQAHFPELKVILTTMTATGAERVRANFGNEVEHFYVPYDLPGSVQRFLARIRPTVAVIMETELWPNIFHCCRQSNIPLILANARLSEQSAGKYRPVRRLLAETLANISVIAAQTDQDAQRLIALGADPAHTHVTGSIKFDVKIMASLREAAAVLRRSLGVGRAVWVAASTHEGEEKLVLDAFDAVKQAIPQSLLIWVPRHPERFSKAAALCEKRGYNTVLRSQRTTCDAQTDVFIGDSMGELPLFYAAADVAFVGGSLIPTGGHNLLEPAALGLAIITGPFMFNFEEITRMMREAGALCQIQDVGELSAALITYLNDANLRYAMGEKGQQLVEENRGALTALLEMIEKYISKA
ncbi:MAG: lipid IV(A) 3-deoxy-D-manno-octulosonic acid transferase [Gammaproteobacteria bacterium]